VEIDAVDSAIALGVLWSCAITAGVFGLRLRLIPRAQRAAATTAADSAAAVACAPRSAGASPLSTVSLPSVSASCDDVLRMCGLFLTAVPVAYFGMLWAGALSPCYLTHAVMLAAMGYAQVLTSEATAGRHGRLWVAVLPLMASVPLMIVPCALAPGAWEVHLPATLALALTGHPHAVRVTTDPTHAAAPVYTVVDFLLRSYDLYARRDVWPAGAWGALTWRWHWWGLRAYFALLTAC
jgi:hypothetical protein